MQFKNLDLQKDIDSKNRELGLSTMNLIKRNEFTVRLLYKFETDRIFD